MKSLTEQVKSEFRNRFENPFILLRSPGRVNLIGEHTDYNNGFVLPAAVDKYIYLAMGKNNSDRARFYALDKDEPFEVDISDKITTSSLGWPNYLLGVVDQLRRHGYDSAGFDCVFGGNVPIGAGMSSSAALEGGVLYGLARLFDWDISPEEMALIAQKAENDFVGVQCGIMDQFVSLNGKKDHAMKLDCRSLEYEFFPFKRKDIHIVLCDTQIRRELASSEYNVRREQCEEGVQNLREYDSSIGSLRDVTLPFLEEHKAALSDIVYQRCRYIVEENERVLAACRHLQEEDLAAFGQLMYQSHEGLRDQYEVSCTELDVLVEQARQVEGVLGARMMGGGFGGCTINLVEDRHLDSFNALMAEGYKEKTGKEIIIYKTRVSGGTKCIDIPTTKLKKEV